MKKILLILSLILSVQIVLAQVPAKPATPTGATPLCQHAANTDYTTTGATGATSYTWGIFPASAGIITGTGTTGTVTWGINFSGIAKIFVKGVNANGTGIPSDTLYVTITPLPSKPGTPVSTSPICQGTVNSYVVTSGATNATSYQWFLVPAAAGGITGTGTMGTVTWSPSFTGIARVITFGINACGQGPVSDTIMITVNPLPLQPATPVGITPICINAANSIFTTAGGTYATSYQWYILPATAGTIVGSSTGLSDTVDWVNTYSGIAKIFVKAVNACGSSVVSDTLSVTITPLPGKPGIPTGPSPLCQGSASTNYTTTGATNATSYQWYILPATAGSITGTTTTGTVNWNVNFSGIAKIFVRGVSNCGTGPLASDTLYVTINPLPGKPGTPVGTSPICQGNPLTSVFATSGSTNSTSFTWSIIPATAGTVTSNGTTTTPTITWNPNFYGVVRIIAFGINACGQGPVSDSLMITINPLPLKPTIPTGTTPLCMDAVNSIFCTTAATFATSYQWYLSPTAAGTILGIGTTLCDTVDWSATFSGVVKVFVKGVNSCGFGPASDTLSVTINPLPGKPATPTGTTPLCQGAPATNYTTTGGTNCNTYQWYILPATAGTIAGTTTTGTVTWNANFTGVARIFVRGINNCGNGPLSSDTLFVTVNPLPAKAGTPVANSPICQGTLTTIVVTSGATNATSYLWNIIPGTAGTIAGTGTNATITWTPSFTGVVRIIVFGVNACGQGPVSDSLMITVNPLPGKPAVPTGPTPLCMGAAATAYTTTGGTNAVSYVWYILPATAGTIAGTGTTGTVTWLSTFSGIAKIFVKSVNACGTSIVSDTLSVTINPLPGKPATPTGTSPLCQGAPPTTFTTTGGTNCTTYQWYLLPATAGAIAGTGTTGTVTWTATFNGVAKIFVRGINACGNGLLSSDTLSVTITPLPSKPGTPVAPSPLCQDAANTNIVTSGGANATSYNWVLLPTTAGTITGTTTAGVIDWSPTFNGIASIIVFGVNACGTSVVSDTLKITITPIPSKPATPTGTVSLCRDAANTIYATTGGANATTYQWTLIPATAGAISGTGLNGTVDWTATFVGAAKIVVKGINACGTSVDSDTLTVDIHPTPIPSLGNDTIICSNNPLSLTPGVYAAYLWQDNSTNATFSATTTGIYWAQITDNFGCIGRDSINVLFINLIANAGNDTTVCPSTPLVLTGSGGISYQWSTSPSDTTQQVTVAPIVTTVYYLTVSANSAGCTATDSVTITVLPQIHVTVNPISAELCLGESITVTASGGLTYLWNGGSTDSVITISPTSNTVLNVTGFDGCGSDTANSIILVHPLPDPAFNTHPISLANIDFPVLCYGATNDSLTYSWFANNIAGSGSPASYSFSEPGTYIISLTVTNKWGCVDSSSQLMTIKDNDVNIWVPNAFSPDFNNRNDVFKPICERELESYELHIFDKWGEQVFFTTDIEKGWDGTFKGQISNPSTYVWIIYYKTYGLYLKHKLTGKVTLIR